MKEQVKLIHGVDWDYLIILDACRADYFLKENGILGDYETVLSPAGWTVSWIETTFPDYYDVYFYSSNPQINSKLPMGNYNSKEHFKQIIDVWDFGWDFELCTVPPWEMYEVCEQAKSKSIIWFLQPHFPSVGRKKIRLSIDKSDKKLGANFEWNQRMAKMGRNGSLNVDDIKEAYADNLRTVLRFVEKLLHHLEGKVIITSDHGEFLGEKGKFLHEDSNHNILRYVPWLEIDKK